MVMALVQPRPLPGTVGARGFSLVELVIVMAISSVILGSAVMIASGVQRTAGHQLDDAAVQQEARYALGWIRQTLASAGSNPYRVTTSACPSSGTPFAPIRLDPNGNGLQDDIRVQSDINPPNGVLLGLSGACTEEGEDVTIALDLSAGLAGPLTRLDRARETTAVPVTDGIFTELAFSYLTQSRTATTNPSAIAYIRVALTGRSRAPNPLTGAFTAFTFNSEVRLRSR
jgi:prepilin-type N-terminal cleavage/methylation domain-containing protein